MIFGALKAVEKEPLKYIHGAMSQPNASFPTVALPKSEKSSFLSANCMSTFSATGICNSAKKDVTSLEPETSPVGDEFKTSATKG